jgi:uncharacterized iron-regulated membrane protein
VRTLRAVLFWTHLAAGLIAGLVILVMCLTGTVLALKPQILAAIDRDVTVVPAQAAQRLPISSLLEAAAATRPDGSPVSIAAEREARAAVSVTFDRGAPLSLDPYRGVVLGERSASAQAFFRTVENWHRWLAMSGEGRATGRAVTGACNAAFLMLAASGIYLWWPRKWSAQHTRAIVTFRRGATSRARDFNWHNVIGFWCAPLIVVMAATGMVMSYPWANDLLYRITGSTPPAVTGRGVRDGDRDRTRVEGRSRSERPGAPEDNRRERRVKRDGAGADSRVSTVAPEQLDRAWRRAEAAVPSWRAITLRLGTDRLAFSIVDGGSWNRFARSQLTIDATNGAVVSWQPYSDMSLGQRARIWVRFSHTGELGGLTGQFLAGIGCVGGTFLVWTGVSLACRRFAAWRARRARQAWPMPAAEGDRSY